MGEQPSAAAGASSARHFRATHAPRPPRSSPRKLFRRFAVASAIAFACAIALGLLLARWQVGARAREQAVGQAGALGAQLAHDDLARTAFRPGGAQLDVLDDFFSPATGGYEPTQVVLYAPNGRVTYATDRSLIGRPAGDPGRVGRALDRTQYRVAGAVQRAFVPVAWAVAPNASRGVLELDHDYTPIAAQVRRDFARQAATIALALAGLYLAMLPIGRAYLNRARTAAIVDYSNDAIIGQTPDNVITTWNAGAQHVYGWTAEEVIGQPIDVLLPRKRPAAPSWDDLDDLSRTTHLRKDGSPVQVSVTVSPIRDAEGSFIGSSMIVRAVQEA